MTTIIGTLSHEFGHYIVAKSLGYKASIHYASATWNHTAESDSLDTIVSQYWKQIEERSSFPAKEKYDQLIRKHSKDSLWITGGGPLQTLLTGTIGLFLLFVWKRSFGSTMKLTPAQWILIFMSLFWLRQIANLIVWTGDYLLTNQFSRRGDEVRIAVRLEFPSWSLITITGIIGTAIVYTVIFKFIPKQQRFTFILSGITGGVAGYIIWLILLGPVLLP